MKCSARILSWACAESRATAFFAFPRTTVVGALGMKSISAFLLSGFLASQALAQDLLAPPLGSPQTDPLTNRWRLAAGQGKWIPSAEGGSGGLQVTGDGEDTGFWRAAVLSLKPGHLYRMRFEGRRLPGASGGTAVSGVERVNRDFTLTPEWQTWDYVFRTPDPAAGGFLRLGQWHANGSMEFRNVELWPVEAVHRRISPGQVLGEAESVENGEYRFNPFLGWAGANYHRTLVTNRAGFNSDRWVFGPGEEIVYRLQAPGARQKSARLRIAINYYDGGRLMVEAGRDGREWRAVATLEGDTRAGAWDLPAELFPGQAVYVRLRHGGTTGAFQVNTIDYRAPLEGQPADATGETGFMDVLQTSPPIAVKLEGVELSRDRKAWQATLAVTPGAKNALLDTGRGRPSSAGRARVRRDRKHGRGMDAGSEGRSRETGGFSHQRGGPPRLPGRAAGQPVPHAPLRDPRRDGFYGGDESHCASDSWTTPGPATGWRASATPSCGGAKAGGRSAANAPPRARPRRVWGRPRASNSVWREENTNRSRWSCVRARRPVCSGWIGSPREMTGPEQTRSPRGSSASSTSRWSAPPTGRACRAGIRTPCHRCTCRGSFGRRKISRSGSRFTPRPERGRGPTAEF